MGVHLPAHGVGVGVGVGGGPDCAQYLPPVFDRFPLISTPAPNDHFAADPDGCVRVSGSRRASVLVAVQAVRAGVISAARVKRLRSSVPPQTIISLPVQTAVCQYRAAGALVMLVAAQLSVRGIVSPTGVQKVGAVISSPDNHFIVRPDRFVSTSASGALVVLVAVQLSVLGLYLPPVLKNVGNAADPPQTIISLPVHTAV